MNMMSGKIDKTIDFAPIISNVGSIYLVGVIVLI